MDIERFKRQHVDILDGIATLRVLTKNGVRQNAAKIANGVAALSQIVTRHLAVEDRILYPMLQEGHDATLAAMGQKYQDEMAHVANPFIAFARKWRDAETVAADPEGFRADANTVLKRVYERMRKEDREFYPAIEAD